MKQFQKNALRLAWRNKGSFVGAACIIAIGIMCMVSMFDTLTNLEGQILDLYKSRKLTDIFATVTGISQADLDRFEDMPGIKEAGGKIATDVRLVTDDQEEIVTVHLMSYDKDDKVNLCSLTNDISDNDIYIGNGMEAVYNFKEGDEIRLVINGVSHKFSYAGTVNAPDYIYAMPPGGAMVPDGSTYDIAVISKNKMEDLLGSSSLTEIGFILDDGYEYKDVSHNLSESLEPYGLTSIKEKTHQDSYQEMQGEFDELSSMGTILPVLFMSISVFMLYIVLKKMIDRDQSLIGTMKAFGMTDNELMRAYLTQGIVIGFSGAILGCIFASPFGRFMFNMYCEFYNLPDPVYYEPVMSKVIAIFIAVATSIIAVLVGIRDILKITPSMAMRQRSPENVGDLKIPALISQHIGFMTKMGLRSISRNPFRGFLIALAIGFPFSMASVLMSYRPLINDVLDTEYDNCMSYDLKVQLDGFASRSKVLDAAASIQNVESAEAIFEKAIVVSSDSQSDYTMLNGIDKNSSHFKIYDNVKHIYVSVPTDGLLINERLAGKLHVDVGDTVYFTIPGLVHEKRKCKVSGVVSETFGSSCYLDLESFDDVLGIDPAANMLLITAKPGHFSEVKNALYNSNRVTWLVDKTKTRQSFSDIFSSMTIMIDMFNVLSVIAGVILIYNISMINLRERTTELVTLRVLGTTDRELGWMLEFEMIIYFILGILMGIPGNYFIRKLLEGMMQTDSYEFKMKFDLMSLVWAFLMCMMIALIAWFMELRLVKGIKLTDALKERE